jgi:hypothetical protein
VKRIIRVLAVAVLMAVILVTSISPALARKVAGGQLLSTEKPCEQSAKHQNDRPGVEFRTFGKEDGRAPGCWALLPPSAND